MERQRKQKPADKGDFARQPVSVSLDIDRNRKKTTE